MCWVLVWVSGLIVWFTVVFLSLFCFDCPFGFRVFVGAIGFLGLDIHSFCLSLLLWINCLLFGGWFVLWCGFGFYVAGLGGFAGYDWLF